MVRAWRNSGVSAQAFCRGRGISAGSLYRWSRAVVAATLTNKEEEMRLVQAVVEPISAPAEALRWELAGPRGTLVVHGPIPESVLRVLVGAVLESGRR